MPWLIMVSLQIPICGMDELLFGSNTIVKISYSVDIEHPSVMLVYFYCNTTLVYRFV